VAYFNDDRTAAAAATFLSTQNPFSDAPSKSPSLPHAPSELYCVPADPAVTKVLSAAPKADDDEAAIAAAMIPKPVPASPDGGFPGPAPPLEYDYPAAYDAVAPPGGYPKARGAQSPPGDAAPAEDEFPGVHLDSVDPAIKGIVDGMFRKPRCNCPDDDDDDDDARAK